MIILSVILLIISFLFQGIFSNVLGYTQENVTFLYTIYPLITLMIIYPYFENKNKFIMLLIIFGLLIDLVYSNTLIFNTCLFYIIYKLNQAFHIFFPYNLFTVNISNLLAIWFYHIVTFLFFIILNFDNYNLSILLNVILNSIIMTLIYSTIIYLLLNFIKEHFELKEVK